MKNIRPLAGLFFLIGIVALATGCTKEDDITDIEYLNFGHFYGLCMGEACVETFQLTRARLFEDVYDFYPGNGPYQFERLSNDQFKQVRELLDAIPDELYNYPETIGCPDCYDQGGLRIEVYDDGELRRWRIDKARSAIPADLLPFIELVEDKISLLN